MIDKNELTSKEYWDNYWGKDEIKYQEYDINKGVFHSYDLLFRQHISDTRKRLNKKVLRVLDCGCGEGLIMRLLAEQYTDIELWGIEYSDSYYKAIKMGKDLGLDFHVLKCDLLSELDPEIVGTFDIVMSLGLIEHFNNPDEIMHQMLTLLRSGGCFITIIPNFHGVFNFLWKLYDKNNYSYHIPVKKNNLLQYYDRQGIEDVNYYSLGVPTIPGLHNVDTFKQKLLSFIIQNLNGRILQKLFPKQKSLDKFIPMTNSVACVGFKTKSV